MKLFKVKKSGVPMVADESQLETLRAHPEFEILDGPERKPKKKSEPNENDKEPDGGEGGEE